jgi:lipopolysaccharide export system protein LptC
MNTRRWKILLLGGSALVAVVLLMAVVRPDRGESASDLARNAGLRAAEAVGKKIHFGDPAQGWDLWLASCRSSEETKTADCSDVRIVYRSSSKGELVVTSERAKATTADWEIDLIGNVTLTSDQVTMHTARAHYSSKQHSLTSDEVVSIVGKGLEMNGTGLDVDVTSQTMRLRSSVVTRIEPKGGLVDGPQPPEPQVSPAKVKEPRRDHRAKATGKGKR